MMQSGQPKKPDPEYEVRLAEMERKYSAILEKIQKYDAGLAKIFEFSARLDDVIAKLNAHISDYVQFRENQEKSFWSTDKIIKNHETVHVNLKADFQNVSTRVEQYDKQHIENLATIGKSVGALNEKLNHIANVVIDKDQMQEIMEHVLLQIEGVANSKQPLIAEIDKLKIDNYRLSEAIRQIQEIPQKLSDKMQSMGQSIGVLESNLKRDITHVSDAQDVSFKIFMQDCEKKLADWKVEILGTPTANLKVKEELEQKMQMAQLDGSNAVIKVNNVEQQIKLLEKKLENLQLQVKRNELAK